MSRPRASPRERPQGFALDRLAAACCARLSAAYSQRGMIAAPTPVPVMAVDAEAEAVVTVWVRVPAELAHDYQPGQYWMCWNPYDSSGDMDQPHHHSEKPYSVGDIRLDQTGIDAATAADTGGSGTALLGFTIKDLGKQSGELTRIQVGDWLGLRGPFGTTFPPLRSGERLILVSGGIGSTPLHMAARGVRMKHGERVTIDAVMGFQNEAEAHFIERMEGLCDSLTVTTDDGSLGTQGFPTNVLPDLLDGCDVASTLLFTCGPEPMMRPVLQMARDAGIRGYAAMERYLPCSIAMCGLCMVGDRLTCTEGPVMEGEWLLDQPDFGHAHAH